jgi:hypothetical protein
MRTTGFRYVKLVVAEQRVRAGIVFFAKYINFFIN